MDELASWLAALSDPAVDLQHAAEGDWASARSLFLNAATKLERGELLEQELAGWVAAGLRALADNKPSVSARAFGLRLKKGKKGLSEEFQRLVAESIHCSGKGLHKSEAGTEGAYTEAAGQFGISPNTAERIYKKYKERLEMEKELEQEQTRDREESHGRPGE